MHNQLHLALRTRQFWTNVRHQRLLPGSYDLAYTASVRRSSIIVCQPLSALSELASDWLIAVSVQRLSNILPYDDLFTSSAQPFAHFFQYPIKSHLNYLAFAKRCLIAFSMASRDSMFVTLWWFTNHLTMWCHFLPTVSTTVRFIRVAYWPSISREPRLLPNLFSIRYLPYLQTASRICDAPSQPSQPCLLPNLTQDPPFDSCHSSIFCVHICITIGYLAMNQPSVSWSRFGTMLSFQSNSAIGAAFSDYGMRYWCPRYDTILHQSSWERLRFNTYFNAIVEKQLHCPWDDAKLYKAFGDVSSSSIIRTENRINYSFEYCPRPYKLFDATRARSAPRSHVFYDSASWKKRHRHGCQLQNFSNNIFF